MKKRNIIIVCIVVFVLIVIVSGIYLIFKDKSGSEVYDLNKDIEPEIQFYLSRARKMNCLSNGTM